jgi:superfamily II DNA/RNA helicase
MGFIADIIEIFKKLPKVKKLEEENKKRLKVQMFSATLTKEIEELMSKLAPKHTLINLNENNNIPKSLKHIQYHVSHFKKKFKLLLYLLKRKGKMIMKVKLFLKKK